LAISSRSLSSDVDDALLSDAPSSDSDDGFDARKSS
jgi:hypothetical protein